MLDCAMDRYFRPRHYSYGLDRGEFDVVRAINEKFDDRTGATEKDTSTVDFTEIAFELKSYAVASPAKDVERDRKAHENVVGKGEDIPISFSVYEEESRSSNSTHPSSVEVDSISLTTCQHSLSLSTEVDTAMKISELHKVGDLPKDIHDHVEHDRSWNDNQFACFELNNISGTNPETSPGFLREVETKVRNNKAGGASYADYSQRSQWSDREQLEFCVLDQTKFKPLWSSSADKECNNSLCKEHHKSSDCVFLTSTELDDTPQMNTEPSWRWSGEVKYYNDLHEEFQENQSTAVECDISNCKVYHTGSDRIQLASCEVKDIETTGEVNTGSTQLAKVREVIKDIPDCNRNNKVLDCIHLSSVEVNDISLSNFDTMSSLSADLDTGSNNIRLHKAREILKDIPHCHVNNKTLDSIHLSSVELNEISQSNFKTLSILPMEMDTGCNKTPVLCRVKEVIQDITDCNANNKTFENTHLPLVELSNISPSNFKTKLSNLPAEVNTGSNSIQLGQVGEVLKNDCGFKTQLTCSGMTQLASDMSLRYLEPTRSLPKELYFGSKKIQHGEVGKIITVFPVCTQQIRHSNVVQMAYIDLNKIYFYNFESTLSLPGVVDTAFMRVQLGDMGGVLYNIPAWNEQVRHSNIVKLASVDFNNVSLSNFEPSCSHSEVDITSTKMKLDEVDDMCNDIPVYKEEEQKHLDIAKLVSVEVNKVSLTNVEPTSKLPGQVHSESKKIIVGKEGKIVKDISTYNKSIKLLSSIELCPVEVNNICSTDSETSWSLSSYVDKSVKNDRIGHEGEVQTNISVLKGHQKNVDTIQLTSVEIDNISAMDPELTCSLPGLGDTEPNKISLAKERKILKCTLNSNKDVTPLESITLSSVDLNDISLSNSDISWILESNIDENKEMDTAVEDFNDIPSFKGQGTTLDDIQLSLMDPELTWSLPGLLDTEPRLTDITNCNKGVTSLESIKLSSLELNDISLPNSETSSCFSSNIDKGAKNKQEDNEDVLRKSLMIKDYKNCSDNIQLSSVQIDDISAMDPNLTWSLPGLAGTGPKKMKLVKVKAVVSDVTPFTTVTKSVKPLKSKKLSFVDLDAISLPNSEISCSLSSNADKAAKFKRIGKVEEIIKPSPLSNGQVRSSGNIQLTSVEKDNISVMDPEPAWRSELTDTGPKKMRLVKKRGSVSDIPSRNKSFKLLESIKQPPAEVNDISLFNFETSWSLSSNGNKSAKNQTLGEVGEVLKTIPLWNEDVKTVDNKQLSCVEIDDISMPTRSLPAEADKVSKDNRFGEVEVISRNKPSLNEHLKYSDYVPEDIIQSGFLKVNLDDMSVGNKMMGVEKLNDSDVQQYFFAFKAFEQHKNNNELHKLDTINLKDISECIFRKLLKSNENVRSEDSLGLDLDLSSVSHELHTCKICCRVFNKKSIFLNHIENKCDMQKPHKCKNCDKAFKVKGKLLDHVKYDCGRQEPHKCETCGNTFKSRSSLLSHKKHDCGDQEPHRCKKCGRIFKWKSSFLNHMRNDCAQQVGQECNKCHKSFKVRKTLLQHMRYCCEGLKSHKCLLCSKTFKLRSSLLRHIKQICGRQEPYKCEFCGKTFEIKRSLTSHTKYCGSYEEYMCRCERTFKLKNCWQSHLKNECEYPDLHPCDIRVVKHS